MSYFTRETTIKSGKGWILTRHTNPDHWDVGLRCTCGWSFSCTTPQTEQYQVEAHVADHEKAEVSA